MFLISNKNYIWREDHFETIESLLLWTWNTINLVKMSRPHKFQTSMSSGPAIFLPKIWVVPWGYPFHWEASAWLMDFLELSPKKLSNIPWLPWRKLWWKCRFHDVSGGQKITYYSQRTWPKWMALYRLWRFSHNFFNIPSPLPTTLVFSWCLRLLRRNSVVDLQGTVPVSSSELSGYIIL